MKEYNNINFIDFIVDNSDDLKELEDFLLSRGFYWGFNKIGNNYFDKYNTLSICVNNTIYHNYRELYYDNIDNRNLYDLYDVDDVDDICRSFIDDVDDICRSFIVKYTKENSEKFLECFSEDYKDFDKEKFMKYFEIEINAKKMGLI